MGHPNPTVTFGASALSGDSKFRTAFPLGNWPGIAGDASGAGKTDAAAGAAGLSTGAAAGSAAGRTDAASGPAGIASGASGNPTLLGADYQARIGGPDVVWHHKFNSDNEIKNFLWSDDIGNNPNRVVSTRQCDVTRITSDGTDVGSGVCCMEILRNAGTNDNSTWWRPMAPIQGGTGSGNGRGAGQNDPGANGTISAKVYAPTQGGGQIAGWGTSDAGRYGNIAYVGEGGYDGTEYYYQVRVKVDPRRMLGSKNPNVDGGKLFYFTRTDKSATDQEIVVYSGTDAAPPGNYVRMYRSVSPSLASDAPGVAVHGDQPGTKIGTVGDGVCRLDNNGGRLANCYKHPNDKWATFLFHVRPGTSTGPLGTENGNSGNNNTLVELFVAEEDEVVYRKIWEQAGVDLPFDMFHGHNAIIASIYQNGLDMDPFFHRYDQMIFSKGFIPCPQVRHDGTSTPMMSAGLLLGSNASTTLPSAAQSTLVVAQMEWQTSCPFDKRNGLIHLMGKQANDDADWSHIYYSIKNNSWTVGGLGMWNNPGHIYGNTACDPLTGDVFQLRNCLNGTDNLQRIRWWQFSTKAWTVTPVNIFTGSFINDTPNGCAFHPHLYGPNDGAAIWNDAVNTYIWRKSNNAVATISHGSEDYGTKEGIGLYWPAQNMALGGGSSGGLSQIRTVRPNATLGGAAVLGTLAAAPLLLQGASRVDSSNFGSLHVHPGNPNKLLLLETPGSRAWTGVWNGTGITWSVVSGGHPFTVAPRVVCSLEGYGYMVAFGASGVAPQFWKPVP